jgi:hypothetical protein
VRARAAVSVVVLLAAIAGVAATQPRLARITHKVKERDDVYAFPPRLNSMWRRSAGTQPP